MSETENRWGAGLGEKPKEQEAPPRELHPARLCVECGQGVWVTSNRNWLWSREAKGAEQPCRVRQALGVTGRLKSQPWPRRDVQQVLVVWGHPVSFRALKAVQGKVDLLSSVKPSRVGQDQQGETQGG